MVVLSLAKLYGWWGRGVSGWLGCGLPAAMLLMNRSFGSGCQDGNWVALAVGYSSPAVAVETVAVASTLASRCANEPKGALSCYSGDQNNSSYRH